MNRAAVFLGALFLLGASFLLGGPIGAQDHWPSFRHAGTSVATAHSPPLEWTPDQGIRWRATVPGYGQSSPVVWNDTIFVTSSDGPWQQRLLVHAIDARTGMLKWSNEIAATTKIENYFRNSRAAPTCVVDDQRVVSFFASGDVTAMNHEGKTIWSKPLFNEYGVVKNERGTASSLAQNARSVFVLVDHDGPSYLIALDKTDGRVLWKADRGNRVPSWASPVVVKSDPLEWVIVSSADSVAAYEAESGDLAWELPDIVGNHIPSATVVGTSVYTGSTKLFHQRGLDEGQIAGSNCRIDLNGSEYRVRWSAERANSYYSSPLVFADYVYYVNKAGILYCVDQETGKQVFAKRIGNPCWASAIGLTTKDGAKYVYLFTKNGFTIVLRPGEEYDQVARNQLWDREEMLAAAEAASKSRELNAVPPEEAQPKTGPEAIFGAMPESALHDLFSYGDPTVYGVAYSNDRLYIRTGQAVYCVEGSLTDTEIEPRTIDGK
ncbi:MAG: PQQ-binding-like beta-propeller repeat protein [Planctomycetota bacterium]